MLDKVAALEWSHNPALYQLEVHAPLIFVCRTPVSGLNIHGAPEGTRTLDPRLRRPLLCPPELLAQIGASRFERPTPCSQGRCATRLRYAP
jgi:hypothetical protein